MYETWVKRKSTDMNDLTREEAQISTSSLPMDTKLHACIDD